MPYKDRQKQLESQRRATKRRRDTRPWVLHYYFAQQRCENPNKDRYKNYGGRGIKCLFTKEDVKKLWFRDKAYLLKRPTIDRINNNGHYIFDNCRFIEMIENLKKSNRERLFQPL